MSHRRPGLALLLGAAMAVGACGGPDLLTRADYVPARKALAAADVERAGDDLPRGEAGGFITTMERSYLDLLQGRPRIEPLAALAARVADEVRYEVTREARSFFYLQTPDDYYPGEHEIVWMHLLLGWGYAQRGAHESACVEVRIADSLLDYERRPEGRFDDPMLRLMAAALWAACGDWEEARVDLRAAARLDATLTWATTLAARETPPAELVVVLGGTGPEPYWSPELSASLLRAGRRVAFRYAGSKSAVELRDQGDMPLGLWRSPDAAPWYDRHLQRNNAIHDLIQDSHFGKDVATEGVIASARIGGNTLLGLGWMIGGVAVGGGFIYLGAQAGSGDTMIGGLLVAGYGLRQGWKTMSEGARDSTRDFSERVDPSARYRMVRFLPEYLWIGVRDTPLVPPLALRAGHATHYPPGPRPFGKETRVRVLYLADVPPEPRGYR